MASPGGREAGRVSVRVVPDTSRFAADLRRSLERIESTLRVQVPVTPDLDGFAQRVRAHLATLRSETVHIQVDTDPSSLDQLRGSITALGRDAGGAGGAVGGLSRSMRLLAAGSLTALPQIASLGASLAQIGPAAALTAPALLALGAAGTAAAIGLSGLGEALSGDAQAMAALAPSARTFATELRALSGAWGRLQGAVQQELFAGLGREVQHLGTSVLPVLRTQLVASAGALNTMAKGVATTAVELAEDGTLGRALASANTGLTNLAGVPALVVQGLVQIGAAAGPAFERLTAGAGNAAQGLSQRLNAAFESGALQATIDRAVDLVGQLFSTLGNLGRALGNIFGPAADAGAGFLGVLESVTATLAEVTATTKAQQVFRGLFETLAVLGQAVSGILGTALRAVMPLLSTLINALAGPLQRAFTVIGPALESLVASLGGALAPAVTAVSAVLARLVPIAARLITMIAGALAPVIAAAGPQVARLVTVLGTALQPVLAQLPALLAPLLAIWTQWQGTIITLAGTLITALTPALTTLGTALGELLVALAPLLEAFSLLVGDVLVALLPLLTPIIALVGQLAAILARVLATTITNVLVPALNILTALLRGDFSAAWRQARALVGRVGQFLAQIFARLGSWAAEGVARAVQAMATLPARAASAAQALAPRLAGVMASAWARANAAVRRGIAAAVDFIRTLPRRARTALGNLGGVLVAAGKALMRGFLDGIRSQFGAVGDLLGGLTGMLPDLKGPPPKDARILAPAGRLVMAGFTEGLRSGIPAMRNQLRAVTAEAAAFRPSIAPQVETAGATAPAYGDRGSTAAVSIGTFVAEDGQSPAAIARELTWLAKARG
ncbi:hypothetical protein ABGB09_29725 [Streptomyces sp. B8F3]|uniref:phage tail protein n=1 Tax=Streptomyces sp. B8F3 TaxID=3153573 RepID=UPI00325ECD68